MIKLIIVDDERATREGLVEFIPWSELGVSLVETAEDGVNALALAERIEPDIVLCDIRMPKMTGIELAEILKERFPQCKIIFLSGYSDKEYLKSAIQLKAIDYIEKPVDIKEVSNIIKSTVMQCLEERKKKQAENEINVLLNESKALMNQRLAFDLINREPEIEELRNKLDFAKLDFPLDASYTTILIWLNLQENISPEQQNYTDALIKIVENRMSAESIRFVLGLKENEYVIIHACEKRHKRDVLKTILDEVMCDVHGISHIESRIFISIGKPVRNISNIHESYRTAMSMQQKQFYAGYNHLVIYDDRVSSMYTFDEGFYAQFLSLLKEGKKEKSIALIKRVVENIRKCDHTPINHIKDMLFHVVLFLAKIAEERNIHITDHSDERKFFWEVISKAATIDEIQEYIIDRITFIFEYISQKENNSGAVFMIMKYIRENYRDKNLSIKTIAENAFLTPTYLCLLFKKDTGKTINQYLTEMRIEKSKEYLKDRKLKIYEVADIVGYSDANYYAKVFEKVVGINPSEYKEKYIV